MEFTQKRTQKSDFTQKSVLKSEFTTNKKTVKKGNALHYTTLHASVLHRGLFYVER